jgi:DNA recombination protein RmuC
MITIFLLIVALVAAGLALWLFQALKNTREKLAEQQQLLGQVQTILEAEKHKNISLETEIVLRKQQQEDDKQALERREATLKEQLDLLGKDIVARGSQALRSENQVQLNQLLAPFKEKLDQFEAEVRATNIKELERHVSMETIIRGLTEKHDQMHNTAQNLADALRGNQKTQGDWGEMALERILEMSGLEKGREYTTQESFRDEQGAILRPDVIIHLPENKHIVIDSKVSLKAFEKFINDENELERKAHLAGHILSIKAHIKQLGDKNYAHLNGLDTPEFVLMFIPLESSFALAIREEPGLYQQAWEKRVVLVTPSTLLATLKTVESIWKQERQTKNAIDIADQAGKLYDKFVGFIADMEHIGKKQTEAAKAYDEAMKKLHTGPGNLLGSTEKLRKMGAKAKKQLDNKFFLESSDEMDS